MSNKIVSLAAFKARRRRAKEARAALEAYERRQPQIVRRALDAFLPDDEPPGGHAA